MENNILQSFIQQQTKPKEEFKEISGTGGKYYISNHGRIISGAGKNPSFVYPWIADNGYYKISIKRNGKRKNLYVHALVAEAFCEKPNINKRLVIHHKNFLKYDNNASNLQYMTYKEHTLLHNKKRAQAVNEG